MLSGKVTVQVGCKKNKQQTTYSINNTDNEFRTSSLKLFKLFICL